MLANALFWAVIALFCSIRICTMSWRSSCCLFKTPISSSSLSYLETGTTCCYVASSAIGRVRRFINSKRSLGKYKITGRVSGNIHDEKLQHPPLNHAFF